MTGLSQDRMACSTAHYEHYGLNLVNYRKRVAEGQVFEE